MTTAPDNRDDPTGLDDASLAARIIAAAGPDTVAEGELVRRFRRRVHLYGRRHLADEAAADDLAQRVMITVLEKLRSGAVREPARIGSFILGVARMTAHEERRGAGRTQPFDDQVPEASAWRQGPSGLDLDKLASCVEHLRERERSVVVQTFFAEQQSSEVAAALGMTVANVRVVRHRAIARLRDCLGAAGGAA